MELGLKGKTALVTGGSAGIGLAIAKGLAAEGVRVCIAARRPEQLKKGADEINAQGGLPAATLEVDITQRGAAAQLASRAMAALGHVDILVNSAGGGRPLALDAPEEAWDEAMMLSFVSRRQLTQALLPGMMERKWGRIINITGSNEPTKINAGFSAKAALQAWCKGLSREIGKYGITINSIPPGRILSEQSYRRYPEEERKKFAEREIPLQRYGEPEEVAALAVFIASEPAGYITGAVLPVDGGMRRYAF